MEYVDIYNDKREKMNIKTERGNLKNGEYSISVHVWVIDNEKLLIQKRASNKKIFPDMWEQSGGGVIAGETSIQAVKRECKEELNIDVDDGELTYIGSYLRVTDIVDIWLLNKKIDNKKIKLQKEEVSDIKFVTFDEFDNMINDSKVVPTINPSYTLLKNYYNVYKRGSLI